MDMQVSGNIGSNWAQNVEQAETPSITRGANLLKDSTAASSLVFQVVQYLQDISSPRLPEPQELGSLSFMQTPPEPENKPSAQGAYTSIASEKAAEFAESNGLNPTQEKQLLAALLLGQPPDDPALAGFYGQLEDSVMSDLASQYPELGSDFKPTDAKKTFEARANGNYEEAFEKELANSGLSKEDIARLRFAHQNRLPNGEIDPRYASGKELELLSQMEGKALSSAQKNLGLPQSFTPTISNRAMQTKITTDYDSNFLASLNDYASANNLSKETVGQLKHLHYHPDASFPDKASLQSILNGIEQPILQSLGKEFGFPSSFQPQTNALSHDAMLNGAMQYQFQQALGNQSPPLSDEQINAVLSFMKNPDEPVSPDIKAIFDQVFANALAQVKADFSLPSNWKIGASLQTLAAISPKIQKAWDVSNQGQERLNEFAKAAQMMSDGPEKNTYLNTLKTITDALSDLKEMMYMMQMKDADLGQKYSEMQKDATLNKIAKQERQMEKMKEKRKKMKSMGPIMELTKAFTYVMIFVAAICACPPLIPLAMALGVAMVASMESGDFIQKGFQEIDRLATRFCEALGLPESVSEVVGQLTKYAVVLGICCAGGFMLGVMFFFQEGKIIEGIAEAAGASETTAGYISMSIQLAVQITVMILLAIIVAIPTGGTGTVAVGGAAVAEVTGVAAGAGAAAGGSLAAGGITAAQVAGQVMQVAGKTIENIAKFVQRAMEVLKDVLQKVMSLIKQLMKQAQLLIGAAQTTLQVTGAGIQANNSFVKMDLALMQGKLDAYLAEMEAFIEVIKKVAQNLMDGLQQIGQNAVDVGQTQQHMWAGRTAALDGVTRA